MDSAYAMDTARMLTKCFIEKIAIAYDQYKSSDSGNAGHQLQRHRNIAAQLFESLFDYSRLLHVQYGIRLPHVTFTLLSLVEHHVSRVRHYAIRGKLCSEHVLTFEDVVNRLLDPLIDRQLVRSIVRTSDPESMQSFELLRRWRKFDDYFRRWNDENTDLWCISDDDIQVTSSNFRNGCECERKTKMAADVGANVSRCHRDNRSLRTMIFYLDVALKSVDRLPSRPRSKSEVNVTNNAVQRALQILGEFLKKTSGTDHLSARARSALHKTGIPMTSLSHLRNTYSHSNLQLLTSLGKSNEEFAKLYEDLGKIRLGLVNVFCELTLDDVKRELRRFEQDSQIDGQESKFADILKRLDHKSSLSRSEVVETIEELTDIISTLELLGVSNQKRLSYYILIKFMIAGIITLDKSCDNVVNLRNRNRIADIINMAADINSVNPYDTELADRNVAISLNSVNDFREIENIVFRVSEDADSLEQQGSACQKLSTSFDLNSIFWECFFDNVFESDTSFKLFLKQNGFGSSLQFHQQMMINDIINQNASSYLEIINTIEYYKKVYKPYFKLTQLLTFSKKINLKKAQKIIRKLHIEQHLKKELEAIVRSSNGGSERWNRIESILMAVNRVYHDIFNVVRNLKMGLNNTIFYSSLHSIMQRLSLSQRQHQIMKEMMLRIRQTFQTSKDSGSILGEIFRDTLDVARPNFSSDVNFDEILNKYEMSKMQYDSKQELKRILDGDEELDVKRIIEIVNYDSQIVKRIREMPSKKLRRYLRSLKYPYQHLLEAVSKTDNRRTLVSSLKNLCREVLHLSDSDSQLVLDTFIDITKVRYMIDFFDNQFRLQKILEAGCRRVNPEEKISDAAGTKLHVDHDIISALEMTILNMLNDMKDFPSDKNNYTIIEQYLKTAIVNFGNLKDEIRYVELRNWLAHGNSIVDTFDVDTVELILCSALTLVNHGQALWNLMEDSGNDEHDLPDIFKMDKPVIMEPPNIDVSKNRIDQSDRDIYLGKDFISEMIGKELDDASLHRNLNMFTKCGEITKTSQSDILSRKRLVTCLYFASFFGNEEVIENLLSDDVNINECATSGLTALHGACANGQREVMKLLIDQGADVNCLTKRYMLSPLHLAACAGSHEAVGVLIDSGANIIQNDVRKRTPLHMALQSESVACIERLLQVGAPVDTEDCNGMTAMHLAVCCSRIDLLDLLLEKNPKIDAHGEGNFTSLQYAVASNSWPAVDMILKRGADVNVRAAFGLTALHVAVMQQDEGVAISSDEIITKLVELSEINVLAVEYERRTALHWASLSGNEPAVRCLLGSNATPSHLDAQNLCGYTPLHYSASMGHEKVVHLLLQAGACFEIVTSLWNSPLHLAATYARPAVTEILLRAGATLNLANKDGFQPLHCAANSVSPNKDDINQTIAILLEHGALINGQSTGLKVTPLNEATFRGNLPAVTLLLSSGADPDVGEAGQIRPVHIAARIGNRAIFDALLMNGADVGVRDGDGMTLLHYASAGGCLEIVQQLMDLGADANARTAEELLGLTPIHVAIGEGHVAIAKLLVRSGADINQRNCDGYTPLHLACYHYRVEIVGHLLSIERLDKEIRCLKGKTALHLAALLGHSEVVALLLDWGARMDVYDNVGYTPLLLACRQGHVKVVNALLERGADIEAPTTDEYSHTPLGLALSCGQNDVTSRLLFHGANIYAVSGSEGEGVIHLAARKGAISQLRSLILMDYYCRLAAAFLSAFGVPRRSTARSEAVAVTASIVNCRNKMIGITPLHCSAAEGKVGATILLLQHRADVNAEDIDRSTPLHFSAFQGHLHVCRILAQYGAIVNCMDVHGLTPLHYAWYQGHTEVVIFLVVDEGAHFQARLNFSVDDDCEMTLRKQMWFQKSIC